MADAPDRGTQAADTRLLAGEIDEDQGPTFVLRGRVVTMNRPGESLDDAQVVISKAKIVAVIPKGQELPEAYRKPHAIDTGATIYPGLIDLHNHFVYNVRPLWPLPKRYTNRGQWTTPQYSAEVSQPVKTLAGAGKTARALVRYVEAKALIGGTTTGQGIRTQVRGGVRMFRGVMRNVEATDDKRLPQARTLVPDLYAKDPTKVEAFRAALESVVAYFYHLAEGIDDVSRQHFTDLLEWKLIQPSLVGIHSLGLHEEDLKELGAKEAKVVWSPFSNLLLYGKTLDLAALKKSGVVFSLGCDWAPTGSKNLLEELKVARHEVEAQNADFTSEDLVHAVTAGAAAVTGWQKQLGTVRADAMADLLVIDGVGGDPWDHLVAATEAQIKLVIIHGTPRYGDEELMKQLHADPDHPLEGWSIGGTKKALHLYTPTSPLNDISLAVAKDRLEAGMADLPKLQEESKDKQDELLAMGDTGFLVELDNEYQPRPEELGAEADQLLAAAPVPMPKSIELDAPEVGAEGYWDLIEKQPNIDAALKKALRDAYA